MIKFQNISFSFDDKDIFRELNISINPGDRIALIGDNGTGKTTLIKLILRELEPTLGVITHGSSNIEYIRQNLKSDERVGLLFEGCEQWRVLAALDDMTLDENVLEKVFSELSGGQATRVQLAAVLAHEASDVLILDEPTNNLDIEAIQWLDNFLSQYKGAVLVASHDRSFIDQFATKVWAIEEQFIRVHSGNYATYKRELDALQAHQAGEYEKEQKEKRKLKKLLVDLRTTASSSKQKKPRDNDKQLRNFKIEGKQAKAGQQVRRFNTKLESSEKTQKPFVAKIYKTSLDGSDRRSGVVLQVEGIARTDFKLRVQNFTLTRGQRLYISGPNGSGKSTLLNILVGRESRYEGMYKWSSSARIGYFSQDVYGIDENLTALDVLGGYHEDIQSVYKQCKTLGLTSEDVHRKMGSLSRGQQAKIGFVSLLLQSCNVLVLDEPTNHLDITSRKIIEDALVQYEGTIIYTSHDTYFVDMVGYDKAFLT